jgi:RND family efflux transporter MFP subunit
VRSRYRFWLAGASALVLAAVGWVLAGRPLPGAPAPDGGRAGKGLAKAAGPELEVGAVAAKREVVPRAFEYTGVVVSPKDAVLRARVTGAVVERPFEPGAHVGEGAVLFRIDPRPFEVALQAAEAQREQAKAQLAFAEIEVARIEPLTDEGFASRQRLQQLESNRLVAAGRLREVEAEVARQRLNLDYSAVRAPFAGRASLSDVNIGDLVTANTTDLVSVVQTDPIDVQVALSAADSAAVQRAMESGEAFVTVLEDVSHPERKARIYKLDNRFDPSTARRLVRAWLENGDERFLPGEFVRTRVRVGEEERVLVPTLALSSLLEQRIVYTIGPEGRVRLTPVETGGTYGDMTAIRRGVDAGALVATDHLQRLTQGQRVRVRRGAESSNVAGRGDDARTGPGAR